MKGVILAGGSGTRLYPLTAVTNKHLLPLYDKPVIFYSIETLVRAGIDRIMIVTSPRHLNDFVSLLGSGKHFISKKTGKQIQIVYGIQNNPSGIAYGLYIAKDYVGKDNCILLLGDNIFEDDLSDHIKQFKGGARIFLKKVKNPSQFGIVSFNKKKEVTKIVEKPDNPESSMAVVGAYIYDNTVFDKMIDQPVSRRGEKEITYINNKYLKEKGLGYSILKKSWYDVGTIDDLLEASIHIRNRHVSKKEKK